MQILVLTRMVWYLFVQKCTKLTVDIQKFSFIFSVDCKWSTWGQWSKCSKSCGIGSQERIRAIATTAKNGGNECVGRNKEINSCSKGACPGMIN